MKKIIFVFLALSAEILLADEKDDFHSTMQAVAADLTALHADLQAVYEKNAGLDVTHTVASDKQTINNIIPEIVVITNTGHIYKGADSNSGLIQEVSKGDRFQYLNKVGDWYAISLNQPNQEISSGWIHAAQVLPVAHLLITNTNENQNVSDTLYKKFTDSVTSLRKKYEENEHIVITGFSVDVSLPPAITIQFGFK